MQCEAPGIVVEAHACATRSSPPAAWHGSPRAQEGPDPPPAEVPHAYDQAASHPVFELFAPRIFVPPLRAAMHPDDVRAGPLGLVQGGGATAWPLLYRGPQWTINASLAATAGVLRVSQQPVRAAGGAGHACVSPRDTATRGVDYDGVGNTWHGGLERLYGGVRWEDRAGRVKLDV
jgi:hypothetical protein